MLRALLLLSSLALVPLPAAGHRLAVGGDGRLAIVAADGSIEWEMPWGAIHDLHVLANGNLMVQRGAAEVVEIDLATRAVVWSYDAARRNGNEGRAVEVHAFQPLADGRVLIAESGPARILEVDRAGTVLHAIALAVDHPNAHTDTRLVRKLENGNVLVCHEGDGVVREYDRAGAVVWDFAVPLFGKERADGHGPEAFGNKCFGALRLANGNTLVTTGNGHGVLEVTPAKEIVWKLEQDDLPGIRLAWLTTVEVLANGHYVIGNCHAGPGQPLLVEIVPATREVVWTFDRYEDFGNSVSNTVLLDAPGARR